MRTKERLKLLATLKETFNGVPIVYMTSERKPEQLFSTQMALDVLPLFSEQFRQLSSNRKKAAKASTRFSRICLFLCTNGGALDTPWPLVGLIREYCKEFHVIVPFKALSAGTLVTLGADKILMSPLSQLSPVDPQGNFEKEGKKIRIEVQDVLGFVDFAKDKIGLAEQESLAEVLRQVSKQVDPTFLGSVNRTYALIRRLSENLLKTHLKSIADEKSIGEIVENLTEKLFSHQHFINRAEAKEIGFGKMIQYAKPDEETLMQKVLDSYYYGLLEIDKPFVPPDFIADAERKEYTAVRAIIESEVATHAFVSNILVQRVGPEAQKQITVSVSRQEWQRHGDN